MELRLTKLLTKQIWPEPGVLLLIAVIAVEIIDVDEAADVAIRRTIVITKKSCTATTVCI